MASVHFKISPKKCIKGEYHDYNYVTSTYFELQGAPKKVLKKNFYSDLFTASVQSFLIYFDSVYLYKVLFGVSFNRFRPI